MPISVAEFRRMVEEQNIKDEKALHPRRGIANKTTEHDTQVRCVNWFRAEFPAYEPFFWSTPNGGYRSAKAAREMKAEGQKAGVPDLFLAYPCKGYHGLFIEMKKSRVGKKGQLIDKGKTSEYQDAMIANLRKVGYRVEVCYSFEQFQQIIKDYLILKL